MKISTLNLFLLFLIPLVSLGQIQFEEGYVVLKGGNKINVLIKNSDWSNNPSEFYYKTDIESEEQLGNLENIKEFAIPGDFKYVNFIVDRDQKTRLSTSKDPVYVSETLFLKQIVEGKADLFYYQDGKGRSYFIRKGDNKPKELVYRTYRINNSQRGTNEFFKRQLFEEVSCQDASVLDFQNLDYDNGDLIEVISQYNQCNNSENTVMDKGKTKGKFTFSLKGGFFSNSLSVDFDEGDIFTDVSSVEFDNKTGPRFAVEFEYVLPFNKHKWSVFMEPGYQSFQDEQVITIQNSFTTQSNPVSVDYSFIDVPIGIRHYFYLGKSRIFTHLALVVVLDLSEKIEYENSQDLDINSSNNLIFGLGYEFNQRFGIEGRVNTNRNIIRDYFNYRSDFGNIGVILSYRFLNI